MTGERANVALTSVLVLGTALLGLSIGGLFFFRSQKKQDGKPKKPNERGVPKVSISGEQGEYPRAPPPTRSGSKSDLTEIKYEQEEGGRESGVPTNPPPSRCDSEACYDPDDMALINGQDALVETDEEDEDQPNQFLRPETTKSQRLRYGQRHKPHINNCMISEEVAAAVSLSLGVQGYSITDNDAGDHTGGGDSVEQNSGHFFSNANQENNQSESHSTDVNNLQYGAKYNLKEMSSTRKISHSVEEVNHVIDRLNANPQNLSPRVAEILTNMLITEDYELLEKILVHVSNAAAFTSNQDVLREAGCLDQLGRLLKAHSMALRMGRSVMYPAVVNKAIVTVNNLAMNETNQTFLQETIPALIEFTTAANSPEIVQLSSLQALTNLSTIPTYHGPFTKVIQHLYECIDHGSNSLRMHALKVLVNLSTNPVMVPYLLAAKAPSCVQTLLKPDVEESLLLRWVTFLANIMVTVGKLHLTADKLPTDYKAPSPETLYTAIYGVHDMSHMKSKIFVLTRVSNEEIKHHASLIYKTFT